MGEVIVADNGPGISPEILPRIGTGLGLSLVHEIVQRNSWLIHVTSHPGCTEFRLDMPITSSVMDSEIHEIIPAAN